MFRLWAVTSCTWRVAIRDATSTNLLARRLVSQPHWLQTRKRTPGRYLVINDTTQLDFGLTRKINGLALTGNNTGRGFLLHTALMVESQTKAIVGVAGQRIHYRQPAPKLESDTQRLKRDRESPAGCLKVVGYCKYDLH